MPITKEAWGGKGLLQLGFPGSHSSLIEENQGRNSKHELKQKSRRSTSDWIPSKFMLSSFWTSQAHLPTMALFTEPSLRHQLAGETMPHSHDTEGPDEGTSVTHRDSLSRQMCPLTTKISPHALLHMSPGGCTFFGRFWTLGLTA